MGRWVTRWLIAGLLGALLAGRVVRAERDAFWIVTATRDESVLVVEYNVANTGVFRDQLNTRVTLLRPNASPLVHRAVAGPAALDGEGVHGALDGLERTKTGWSWEVSGEAMRLRGQLRGGEIVCPGEPSRSAGVLDIPDPAVDNGGEVVQIDGPSIIVRTGAVGNAGGNALFAVDNRGAVALDPLSLCPSWIQAPAGAGTGLAPWIPADLTDDLELEFAGHRLVVHATPRSFVDSPADTTLWPERFLAWVAGYRVHGTTLVRVRVSVDGAPPWTGVVVVRSADSPFRVSSSGVPAP